MDTVTASDWGYLGALEKDPARAWSQEGILENVSAKLERIASRMLSINPKGGRPNKHATKDLRSRRPAREVLMPHDADYWPVRPFVAFE